MKRVAMMMIPMLVPLFAVARPLSEGLIAHYKFDGNAKDSTVNHLDGTVCGATLTEDRFGRQNSAYMFGHGVFIMVSNSPLLKNLRTECTISAWICPTEWHQYRGRGFMPIMCKGSKSTNVALNFYSDPACSMGNSVGVPMSRPPSFNVWQHVLCTSKGSMTEVYINGEKMGCVSAGLKVDMNDDPLKIGCDDPVLSEYFHGAMDDIRIYKRVFSASEVAKLYREEAGKTGKPSSKEDVGGDDSHNNVDVTDNGGTEADNIEASSDGDCMFPDPIEVPDQAQIANANKMIAELCEKDIGLARKGRISNSELAARFLDMVDKTESVPAKFVLLRNAFQRLVTAGKIDAAGDLFDRMCMEFGTKFAVAVAKPCESALTNKKLSANASAKAAVLKSKIAEMQKCIDGVDEADDVLSDKSNDVAARKKKALNSLKIGDWKTALSIYAELDGDRGPVAKWELSDPECRSDKYTAETIGDYWWAVGESAKVGSIYSKSVCRHAVYWYRQALQAGEISELKRSLIEKRISSVVGKTGKQKPRGK